MCQPRRIRTGIAQIASQHRLQQSVCRHCQICEDAGRIAHKHHGTGCGVGHNFGRGEAEGSQWLDWLACEFAPIVDHWLVGVSRAQHSGRKPSEGRDEHLWPVCRPCKAQPPSRPRPRATPQRNRRTKSPNAGATSSLRTPGKRAARSRPKRNG